MPEPRGVSVPVFEPPRTRAAQPRSLVEHITAMSSSLLDADVPDACDDEVAALIVPMEQARALLDAAQARLVGRFDAAQMCTGDGHRSPKAWLCQHAQMSGSTVAQRLRVARTLRCLDHVRAGAEAGDLSHDQVLLFARVYGPRTEEAMRADQEALVGLVRGLTVDDAAIVLCRWKDLADADGTKPDDGLEQRSMHLSSTFSGNWTGRFDLPSADGALVSAALAQVCGELWRQERRDTELDPGFARTPAQRRADALVELVRRAISGGAGGAAGATGAGGPGSCAHAHRHDEYHGDDDDDDDVRGARERLATPMNAVTLLVPIEDLVSGAGAATIDGDRVRAAGLDRMKCYSAITPITWSLDGVPLDHGRTKRFPTAAQKRALIARDRGCIFPGCCSPASDCQTHHVDHWVRDQGRTDLVNLWLVCWYHHRLLHEAGWELRTDGTGPPVWIRPGGQPLDTDPGW